METSEMTKIEATAKEKAGTNPASFFRRFIALILDLLVIGFLSACLEIGMAKAFKVSEIKNTYNTSVTAVDDYVRGTHLLYKDDIIKPTESGQSKMYEQWLNNQLSDDYNKDNDCLYYYYVTFKGQSIDELNSITAKDSYKGLFDTKDGKVYRITSDSRSNILKYLHNEDLDKAEVTNTYNKAKKFFNAEYKNAWVDILKDGNYVKKVDVLNDNMKTLLLVVGQSSLTSYSIVAFVYFSLTPLVIKKGRTLGKMLCKIQVKTKDYDSVKWHNVIIRGCVQTIMYSCLLLYVPIMVLPQFWYQTNIFYIGNFAFSTISQVVVSLILIITSFMFSLFRDDKASLTDYLSGTLTTDISPLETTYIDNKNEIRG